ncbi:hypothetical protein SSP24_39980 [Streptomyces spinoverrucosus]|uniref:Uncharacterized protein n=1 Tax=Streptomyces spinoverrucosus TaxID=284043 RepID=A0A4Y3VII4_9ACTN|nr:hypothetical protein SSP24_39980 [Streptomyces spinoverrucosus]GHB76319.1 hypothetical protein GCM10010397_53550 [Streptomyces spinoverrucosus]
MPMTVGAAGRGDRVGGAVDGFGVGLGVGVVRVGDGDAVDVGVGVGVAVVGSGGDAGAVVVDAGPAGRVPPSASASVGPQPVSSAARVRATGAVALVDLLRTRATVLVAPRLSA